MNSTTNLSARLSMIIICCGVLFSCTSKIPYGSTYYFPLEPVAKKEKTSTPEKATEESKQVMASIEKLTPIAPSTGLMLEKANNNVTLMAETNAAEEVNAPRSSKKAQKTLSKKEIKQEKKEARKALKQAVKAYKHDIKEQKKENAQKDLSKNMKIGIIIAAVGLILLILPLGYIGYILGSIGLVVGLVLILIEAL